VAGLIAGKKFQDPLREGAEFMTMSTHKTFFGPQHGAIVGNPTGREVKDLQRAIFPANVSNHHVGNMAGVGLAAFEMLTYGEAYASQVILNAQKLAEYLVEKGYKVIGENQGYTESHMILLDVSGIGGGKKIERRLEEFGIIANKNLLPWDRRFGRTVWNPGGMRIGVQEVTRLGMKESDMSVIVGLIDRTIRIVDKSENYSSSRAMGLKDEIKAFRNLFVGDNRQGNLYT